MVKDKGGQHGGPLSIRLTEPIIYLKSSATGEDFRGRRQLVQADTTPAILRGVLTLRLQKPTRIKKIEIKLEGKARTEWPEGIGSRRQETSEEHTVISDSQTFFDAAAPEQSDVSTDHRRAYSIPPSARFGAVMNGQASGTGEAQPALPDQGRFDEPRGRTLGRSNARADGIQSGTATPLSSWDVSDPSSDSETTNRPDRLTQERGPSPAYAYRDPLKSLRRGSNPAQSDDTDGGDIGSMSLSPRASQDNLYAAFAVNPPDAMDDLSRRAVSNSMSRRILEPASHRNSTSEQSSLRNGIGSSGAASPHPLNTSILSATPSLSNSVTDLHELNNRLNHNHAHRTPHFGDLSRPERASHHHPLHANVFSALTTRNNSRTSLHDDFQLDNEIRTHHHLQHHQHHHTRSPMYSVDTTRNNSQTSLRLSSELQAQEQDVTMNTEPPLTGLQSTSSSRTRSASSTPAHHSPLLTPSISQDHVSNDHDTQPIHHAETSSHQAQDRGRSGSRFSIAAALRSISRAASGTRSSSQNRSRPPPGSPTLHPTKASRIESLDASPDNSPPHTADSRDGRIPAGSKSSKTVNGTTEDAAAADASVTHKWKEMRKGTYNFPISFTIPPNLPPTIHADFGTMAYRLTATVHRQGTLHSNYVQEMEVVMITSPQEDDMEETENILVERQWEDQMRYLIALSGKAFTIGGQIPISIRIMPMSKCKIFRISAAIEEKVDYYALNRRIARHETPNRYPLLSLANKDDAQGFLPLLPVLSESADALRLSPLSAMAVQARSRNETTDDAISQLLEPFGPWYLETLLQVPDCLTKIKFSTKHESTNMAVTHWLKVILRVQRGDDQALDSKGRRKQFDIIIETPLHLLDCRATAQNNSLPAYNIATQYEAASSNGHAHCRIHRLNNSVPIGVDTVNEPHNGHGNSHQQTAAVSGRAGDDRRDRTTMNGRSVSTSTDATVVVDHFQSNDTFLERNIVFDRLVSGQESEVGEIPPPYDESLVNRSRSEVPRGRATTRVVDAI